VSHTLLLADDSITIQRVIELTFADEDVRVVAVSDGHQAIARIDEVPPDIVLADVGMPGTDGYEVARHIRSTPKLAHIPVLLLTGAFEPVDPVKAAEVGCQGVLTKPFEPQMVIQRVRELLAGTSTESSAAVVVPLRATPAPSGPVEAYFEQLDAAFATLPGAAPKPIRPPDRPSGRQPIPVSLAEAFAALLAAEQTGAPLSLATVSSAPSAAERDAIVEEIVRRVLERLSDQVVREQVGEIVLTVAERLVREEIEKIRGSVR
jgi:CheY-like chemotaxis protein